MELLSGETLSERLQKSGKLSLTESLPLIEQMAAALSAAHEAGVIRRDFKSANVMLSPTAAGPRVCASSTDFGLARSNRPGRLGGAADRDRGRARNAGLHGARADRRACRQPRHRRLCPGDRDLRDGHGRGSVPGRHPPRSRCASSTRQRLRRASRRPTCRRSGRRRSCVASSATPPIDSPRRPTSRGRCAATRSLRGPGRERAAGASGSAWPPGSGSPDSPRSSSRGRAPRPRRLPAPPRRRPAAPSPCSAARISRASPRRRGSPPRSPRC
jgi:serine/threonine protein kinase